MEYEIVQEYTSRLSAIIFNGLTENSHRGISKIMSVVMYLNI